MKSKKILAIIFVLALMLIFTKELYAKYVLEIYQTAVELSIDRTKPIGEVTYSTKEIINGVVLVKISLSEPIQEVEGWVYNKDENTLTKTYDENKDEIITIIDLSGNENQVKVSVRNIDKEKPTISLVGVDSTNTNYENYANKTHTITAHIKVTDKNINEKLDIEKLEVYVGDSKSIFRKDIKNIQILNDGIQFDLELSELENDGELKLTFLDDFIIDKAGNKSEMTEINLGIIIDNTPPEGKYLQEALESGKIKAIITANEKIREIEGWENVDDENYTKEFPADVAYEIKILDYAENEATVKIDVTGATYIILTYASHNSEVGWTYGMTNYDVAGGEAVEINPKYKTEALAFRISGGVDKEFVKIRGYVYSYWNNIMDYGKSEDTGYMYKLRYAPSSDLDDFYTMAYSTLATIDDSQYMQIGGTNINRDGGTDCNGENVIPHDAIYSNGMPQYPYGVSAVQIALADYSELSVVYQILVNEKGWLEPAYNGEETTASLESPMSAIRMAIVPNSELKNIIEMWEKDVGTYNVGK